MKPGPLGYHRADSVPRAVGLLSAYEGTARVIAGGQSLVPMLSMRLIQPDALVDLNGLAELAQTRTAGDATVLGALVRYTTIEQSPVIAGRLGLLARMVRHIGDRQVRNRGTIGGSLAQGDPTGEMPLACLVLGASVRVTGPAATVSCRWPICTRAPTQPSSGRARCSRRSSSRVRRPTSRLPSNAVGTTTSRW